MGHRRLHSYAVDFNYSVAQNNHRYLYSSPSEKFCIDFERQKKKKNERRPNIRQRCRRSVEIYVYIE